MLCPKCKKKTIQVKKDTDQKVIKTYYNCNNCGYDYFSKDVPRTPLILKKIRETTKVINRLQLRVERFMLEIPDYDERIADPIYNMVIEKIDNNAKFIAMLQKL